MAAAQFLHAHTVRVLAACGASLDAQDSVYIPFLNDDDDF